MMQSENINELVCALSKAQGEISPAEKSVKNPFFKSKYADLSSVWAVCREPLSKNGLAVIQTMEEVDGKLKLLTTLAHSSGQWIRSSLPIISAKMDSQGIGSAITYMRRYSLSSIVGIVADDDDGENSMGRGKIENSGYKSRQEQPKGQPEVDLTPITTKQCDELSAYLNGCPEQYRNLLWNTLYNEYGISTLDALPAIIYNRVLETAMRKCNENSKPVVLEALNA